MSGTPVARALACAARPARIAVPGIAVAVLATIIGCGGERESTDVPSGSRPAQPPLASGPTSPSELPPVVLPDLSRLGPSVQKQLHDARVAIGPDINATPPTGAGAESYGHLGKLLLATGFRQPAEASFRRAEALSPGEARWPYYLGHVYYANGDVSRAAAAFLSAHEAAPTDVPTMVWLGRTHFDLGHLDAAAGHFRQALDAQPRLAAALLGLGQVRIAQKQYGEAIPPLEDALAIDPQAGEIRHALATAYRRTGAGDRAAEHERPRALTKVRLPDPLLEEIDTLLETAVAYEIRGGRAMDRRDWTTAITSFRRGIELSPEEPALRHKLATALSLSGDGVGAMRQFDELVRRWPTYAKGRYSLGVVLASNGRYREAAAHLAAASTSDPLDVQAHLQLAETQRVLGRFLEALTSYDRALALDPRLASAHFGGVMALVGVGRYRDALDRLDAAVKLFPAEGAFGHTTARLLAAAPVDDVRNGERALVILRTLGVDDRPTIPLIETMAMALAEVGRYEDAARWQREAIERASTAAGTALLPRLRQNLRLYGEGKPCRVPWGDELRVAALQ